MQAGGRRFDPAWLHQRPQPLRKKPEASVLMGVHFWFLARTHASWDACACSLTIWEVVSRRLVQVTLRLELESHVYGHGWVCCIRGDQRHMTPDWLGLYGQANKRIRWMPRRQQAMKDVAVCDKPRGAGKQALIRGCPNGETHPARGIVR